MQEAYAEVLATVENRKFSKQNCLHKLTGDKRETLLFFAIFKKEISRNYM